VSLKTWFIATRPWSLGMTFISTCLAGILSYAKGSFDPTSFLLVMLGLMIAHTAANMTNDYYDVKHGVDENAPTAKYRPHPLLNKEVSKSSFKIVIIILYLIGISISIFFTLFKGFPVLIFTALGVLLGIFYTADPVMLKYRSIGELCVFLAFGPLMVGGAYYVLTGIIALEPMIISVPIGLLVALVLLANNLRDREFDARLGIKTITTNKNMKEGLIYYEILMIASYFAVPVLIFTGLLSIFSLLVVLTIPEAIIIIEKFNLNIPLNSDQITSQLALHFGILYIISELINTLIHTI